MEYYCSICLAKKEAAVSASFNSKSDILILLSLVAMITVPIGSPSAIIGAMTCVVKVFSMPLSLLPRNREWIAVSPTLTALRSSITFSAAAPIDFPKKSFLDAPGNGDNLVAVGDNGNMIGSFK